ncbi:aminomuconate-semialdehyde/2-hydroxymuconate-6-semialdehyde dehydrogenase [Thermonema lapsum]|uniref:Aminomuconate-semialdehyde/2-hydroxymuconate-6-semialdehyde dehydrogenase n=1 Tax=Thermonema lapsum TaxID=28195 RepID=A0A846MLZ7_9BACT|nr:aldehyde dehydrogenase [Thermonema lapsum]NIK72556.1 aminomuconate-semialdehyde/2-hydroxymuconate-6-semialdehyde dehydrogenase [Thermonema lapsum]
MQRLMHYIHGQWCPPASGEFLPVVEPATGEVYAEVGAGSSADVEAAVQAAQAAFPAWASMSVRQRAHYLLRIAEGIEARLALWAEAESRDTGKPLSLAQQVDIPRAALNFEFFATAIMQMASESYQTGTQAINYVLRQPLGVVACISPWNLPLYLFTWKIAPALAAGNCVVAKPSELTPMTATLLAGLCQEVGLPPGVLNIVHGTGSDVGEPMVVHPQVKAVSFTGGTRTGSRIAALAAPQFKKLSLELGGKNPTIVFADANYEQALEMSVRAAFRNQGEICLCGSRLLVEASLYERFKTDFVKKVQGLRVGDPLDPATDLGALISDAHRQKVLSYVALAKEEGGRILTGGKALELPGRCAHGYFMEPTVIEGLDAHCRTNQEEIFGPVVTLIPFNTEEEAIYIANATPYGLSASVWTQNLARAHRVAAAIEAGIVWVNTWMLRDLRTPFGGVKASGVGREGGFEALRFFTEPKNVCISYE